MRREARHQDQVGEASGEKENVDLSPNSKPDDEPVKDEESNGQIVPVLKIEDVEVTGAEEDKEAPKPTMSKVASMKRDLSFGRLQKMFSREPKSESQQDSSSDKAGELEPSPVPEVSATKALFYSRILMQQTIVNNPAL